VSGGSEGSGSEGGSGEGGGGRVVSGEGGGCEDGGGEGGAMRRAAARGASARAAAARAAARAAASRAGAARVAAARVAAAWAEATRAAAAHHLLERGEHAVGALPPREIAASSDSVLNPYTISYPDRFNKEPSHALPVSSNALPAHQAVLGDRIEGLLLVGKTLSWKLSDMNLYPVYREKKTMHR
jgi:hypothetical protein